MKEAKSLPQLAAIVRVFVNKAQHYIRATHHGWYDKFTGDGLLSYWPYVPGKSDFDRALRGALNAAHALRSHFHDTGKTLKGLRRNSHNFPADAGLAIGLDAGPALFAVVADQLTSWAAR